jgi:hypothetical protein
VHTVPVPGVRTVRGLADLCLAAGDAHAGDTRVLFSALVTKVDRRHALHERVLLVSDRAVYNLDPGTYRLKRRIALAVRGADWPTTLYASVLSHRSRHWGRCG